MSGLLDAATAVLSASERRLEIVSQNIANVTTSGYKRQIGSSGRFSTAAPDAFHAEMIRIRSDMSAGKMSQTGNPLDLAINGSGFFQLRAGRDMVYSRQAAFRLSADGTVISPQGYALQQAGGGDLMLDRDTMKVLADGTVLDGDRPIARIAVFAPREGSSPSSIDGTIFNLAGAPVEMAVPDVRQGMAEASNVVVGDEMVTMMTALRQAESGARLVQTYDDLIGKAITAFGQAGR